MWPIRPTANYVPPDTHLNFPLEDLDHPRSVHFSLKHVLPPTSVKTVCLPIIIHNVAGVTGICIVIKGLPW